MESTNKDFIYEGVTEKVLIERKQANLLFATGHKEWFSSVGTGLMGKWVKLNIG